jgi:hypothetical protein
MLRAPTHLGVVEVWIGLGSQQRRHSLDALAVESGGEECRAALRVRVIRLAAE